MQQRDSAAALSKEKRVWYTVAAHSHQSSEATAWDTAEQAQQAGYSLIKPYRVEEKSPLKLHCTRESKAAQSDSPLQIVSRDTSPNCLQLPATAPSKRVWVLEAQLHTTTPQNKLS
jgi:hypothetical protein